MQVAKTRSLEESRVALAKIPNPTKAQIGQLNSVISQQQNTLKPSTTAPTVSVKSALPTVSEVPGNPITGKAPEPAKSAETISEAVGQTYAEQADLQEKGSYLEYADTYKKIMGTDAPFKTRDEYIAWRKNQNQSDLDFLDKQQDYSRQIEGVQFQIAKEQAAGSTAATTAGMAQGREGAMSGTAPIYVKEYKQQMDRSMKQLEIQRAAAEMERTKQQVDLVKAQESGDMALVDTISGRIASIESDLRQNDSQQLQIATQANQQALEQAKFEHSVSMDTTADYRANLGAFTSMVDNGNEMSTAQVSSMAKGLDIPFDVAQGYYEGAKSIRDNKQIDTATKQIALKDLNYEFNQKIQGIRGAQAQAVSDFTKLAKSGNYTQAQLQSFAVAMNIPNGMNPMYQSEQKISTANALIKQYEADNLGKPPKEGTIERLEYDKAQLDLRVENAKYKDFTGVVSDTDVHDIFYQQGHGKWNSGEGQWQCAEGSNKITDGPNLGSTYASKTQYVTKQDMPQIGNQLVIPYGDPSIGHVATVISFNPITQQIQTVEWNHNGDGKQSSESYNLKDLATKYAGKDWGFTDSHLKPEYADKLTTATPNNGGELDQTIVEGLANYQINPTDLTSRLPAGTTESQRSKYLSAAMELNPTYSEAKFSANKAFIDDWQGAATPSSTGFINNAANTAIKHLNTAYQVFEEMGNAGITDYNGMTNYLKEHAGDPAVAAYQSIIEPLSGEVGKVITGGVPNESTLKNYRETFSPNQSPAQMKAVIKTQLELMAGRIGTNVDKYQKTMGVLPPNPVLDEESVKALKDMGLNPGKYDPSLPGDAPATEGWGIYGNIASATMGALFGSPTAGSATSGPVSKYTLPD